MSGLPDYIRPDHVHAIPIEGGELRVAASHDVVHRFDPLGAVMLKYWDADGHRFCNVLMTPQSGDYLVNEVGLMEVHRPFITASEHDMFLGWSADNITDNDFGL